MSAGSRYIYSQCDSNRGIEVDNQRLFHDKVIESMSADSRYCPLLSGLLRMKATTPITAFGGWDCEHELVQIHPPNAVLDHPDVLLGSEELKNKPAILLMKQADELEKYRLAADKNESSNQHWECKVREWHEYLPVRFLRRYHFSRCWWA